MSAPFFGYTIVDDLCAVRGDGEYETADAAREAALAELREWRRHPEIDRDGKIYQYAALDRKCCHCGSCNFQFVGVDLTSIGVPLHVRVLNDPDVFQRALFAAIE